MLQRLAPSLFELDAQCGQWSRSELEVMNDAFVACVEAAFKSGFESRAAASATVRVGQNGEQRTEVLIESAWHWLRANVAAGNDVTFVEVAARCPGVNPSRVHESLKRRLMQALAEGCWA